MTWVEAVQWCKSLGDGFELPDRLILLACYMNEKTRGEFREYWYWSSTEFSATYAWGQHFSNGTQDYNYKDGSHAVRVVRKVEVNN